jgi:adenine-specific DNA-methyltransferase
MIVTTMKLIKRVIYYNCNNSEEVGITTEKIICNVLGIKCCTNRQIEIDESNYIDLQRDISESIGDALRQVGTWKHVGGDNKECDYYLENGKTVSIKTNSQGDKVCPQNIGQPSLATFNKYFKCELKSTDEFKTYFLRNTFDLLKDYLNNVFVCDETFCFRYMDGMIYRIKREVNMELNLQDWKITTTRTKETWNESNTVKISKEDESISLAEIQVHNNRNCIKFRFHLNAILRLVNNRIIRGLTVREYKLENMYVFKVKKDNMDIDNTNMKQFTLPTSFNYIGSKIKLLPFIGETIKEYTGKQLEQIDSFMDCFSGTGVVSHYMMQRGIKKVITNDIQHYAAVISSVWTSKNIDKAKLKSIILNMNNLMNLIKEDNTNCKEIDFVYNNYTPAGDRMYFTKLNGYKIDKVRQEIENHVKSGQVTKEEYKCLLKVLLYAVTSVSNIASVYGAYLKKFKQSAKKDIKLDERLLDWLIDDNTIEHITYNDDIIHLLSTMDSSEIECGYFDSPYNSRGYSDNYHVLETISRYDYPTVKGKTGLRKEEIKGAKAFTSKVTTKDAFQVALGALKTKYVFISYSSESIVSKEKMISIMEECGWRSIRCIEKDYTRFKSNNKSEQAKGVTEYIFCGRRDSTNCDIIT